MMLAIIEAGRYGFVVASISDQLRRAIEQSGQSRYAIWKATGVAQSTLSRFMAGEGLTLDVIDRLARHLGLNLTTGPAKLTPAKPTGKRVSR